MQIESNLANPTLYYRLDPGEPGLGLPAKANMSILRVASHELGNIARFKREAAREGGTVVYSGIHLDINKEGAYFAATSGKSEARIIYKREEAGHGGRGIAPTTPGEGQNQEAAPPEEEPTSPLTETEQVEEAETEEEGIEAKSKEKEIDQKKEDLEEAEDVLERKIAESEQKIKEREREAPDQDGETQREENKANRLERIENRVQTLKQAIDAYQSMMKMSETLEQINHEVVNLSLGMVRANQNMAHGQEAPSTQNTSDVPPAASATSKPNQSVVGAFLNTLENMIRDVLAQAKSPA
ncbi:MAG: hypothetical protein AB1797_11665 [bacterium]